MDQIVDELSKVRFKDSDKLDPESFFVRIKEFYTENPRHKYSEISKEVYKFQGDRIDILRINLEKVKLKASENDEAEIIKKIDKLIDHADLAEYQRKLIEDIGKESRVLIEGYYAMIDKTKKELLSAQEETENAKSDLTSTKEQIETAQKELLDTKKELKNSYKDISNEVNDLKKQTTGIYTQFITILGIFSAIVFGAFGGVEILENILGNISDVPTPKLIVFSSLSIAGIISLLFVLISGIARLTDRNIRSCNCATNDLNCNHSVFTKHPTIIVLAFTLIYTAMIGAFGYITDYEHVFDLYNMDQVINNGVTLTFALLLISLPIAFLSLFYYKRKKDRDIDTKRIGYPNK